MSQLWWQDLASFIATASCAPNVKSALIWCRGYIFVLAMMGQIRKGANPQHSIWYCGLFGQRPSKAQESSIYGRLAKYFQRWLQHSYPSTVLNMNHKKEPQVTCTIEALCGVVGIQPSFAAAITCMFHESMLLGVAWKGALLAPLNIETLQNDTVIFVQHAHFHQEPLIDLHTEIALLKPSHASGKGRKLVNSINLHGVARFNYARMGRLSNYSKQWPYQAQRHK